MCYIYLRLLFGIACLAYHTAIKFALYQPLYPEFIVIVSTSNELQPHLCNLLAHSMANITVVHSCCNDVNIAFVAVSILLTHDRNAEWYVLFAALPFKLVYGVNVICRRALAPKFMLVLLVDFHI